jgi:hypothetical protein
VTGALIETDRCRTLGPTPGVDVWWSGKHAQHGGNVQVITAPDGWPIWTFTDRTSRRGLRLATDVTVQSILDFAQVADVRKPRRQADATCSHPEIGTIVDPDRGCTYAADVPTAQAGSAAGCSSAPRSGDGRGQGAALALRSYRTAS